MTSFKTDAVNVPKGTIGVYMIWHLTDNRFYIGASLDVRRRTRRHRTEMMRKIHGNKFIQKLSDDAGLDGIRFSLLEISIPEQVFRLEDEYIARHFDSHHCLNLVRNTSGHGRDEREILRKCKKLFHASMTEEERISHGERVSQGLKHWNNARTSEERSQTVRKGHMTMSDEQKQQKKLKCSKHIHEALQAQTPEERSERAKRRWANTPSDVRREIVKKSWETRKAKQRNNDGQSHT